MYGSAHEITRCKYKSGSKCNSSILYTNDINMHIQGGSYLIAKRCILQSTEDWDMRFVVFYR